MAFTPKCSAPPFGVFVPHHHQLRAQIVPATRSCGRQQQGQSAEGAVPAARLMTRAQRLARVFAIDVTSCERCGGAVKIIAYVRALIVIRKILDRVERAGPPQLKLPPARIPTS